MKKKKVVLIEPEKKRKIIESIRERLPKKAKILCLSLTGSRAFGWTGENYDYDIHGLFAAKNFWDWVHLGEEGFDINLYELSHVYSDIYYQHFEFFQNLANPFYIQPGFDYSGLMKFCAPKAAKFFEGTILSQIHHFETTNMARPALHAYRVLMVTNHFLKKRKFQLNVFKLNKNYHFQQLEKLKNAYLFGGRFDFESERVKRDLKYLLKEYKKLCQKAKKVEISEEKIKKWCEKMKKRFY